MKITVKLFATLREHIKDNQNGTCGIDLQEQATVAEVLAHFHIPEDIPKIILINGVQKAVPEMLHEGDTLSVFPPIAGG